MTGKKISLLVMGVIIITFLIFMFVDPTIKDRVLAMIGLAFPPIALILVEYLRGLYDSPVLVGYGWKTSLESTDPVKTVDVPNPEDPKNPFKLDIYPNHGCRPFWMAGGGKHGYCVVRRDLTFKVSGDKTSIIALTAPPDMFKIGAMAGSEYMDMEEMGRELYDAIRQLDGFHPKAKVACFWDSPTYDPLADWDEKEGMPWKHMAQHVNKENMHLRTENRRQMTYTTQVSKTHQKAVAAIKGDIEDEKLDEDQEEV